jgi:hypothetical protein
VATCGLAIPGHLLNAQSQPAKSRLSSQRNDDARTWLKRVRIAAYPLTSTNAESIVLQARESHVYGIEVDNDIPGRYESLLHPQAKLDAL